MQEKVWQLRWSVQEGLEDIGPFPSLFEASSSNLPVLCLFLVEPQRLAQPDCDPIHIEWELDCAYELRKKLEATGANLDIMHKDALEAMEEIHAKHTISRIRSHEETGTSWSFDRDKRVSEWCVDNKVEWIEYPNNGAIRGMKGRDKWKHPEIAEWVWISWPLPRE